MTRQIIDFDKSLEDLTGLIEGNPDEAPTPLVGWIRRSWKKPLRSLTDEEIGRLIRQRYGIPYILDVVWIRLRRDPLFEGGSFPGDVLSNLIRWEKENWKDRPEYEAELKSLYERAIQRPIQEKDGFLESLGLPIDDSSSN
ncbi:MAG: contact-dependent growth inhibition system immunity protein [Blastomonas sp.]|nr:contact-dependent growth inhibition system immunity protein [Blastomonas sp.]